MEVESPLIGMCFVLNKLRLGEFNFDREAQPIYGIDGRYYETIVGPWNVTN